MDAEHMTKAFMFPEGLAKFPRNSTFSPDCLTTYSIFREDDPDREEVMKLLKDGFDDEKLDRAMGTALGNVIGDALGAPLEFSDVRYGSNELKGLEHKEIWVRPGYNRFGLKPGQWTDDASMAFCLGDSLLVHQPFNPRDLRLRFLNWWHFGYCNAFGADSNRAHRASVGLGGNISQSFMEFQQEGTEYTKAGDRNTSGNGSIMRNFAVPVYYHDNIELAEEVAYKQSKTTHQGDEAAECARLLTHICVSAFTADLSTDKKRKEFLLHIGDSFTTERYSVQCLAEGKKEAKHADNKQLDLEDRQWDWKSSDHRYSANRSRQQPGYIGSYAMDGLCMALHCVYSTDSFEEALLKCANMRGDADTVCAIAGQIAGAIYGASAIPKQWIEIVEQWDPAGNIPLRAYKLYTKNPIDDQPVEMS